MILENLQEFHRERFKNSEPVKTYEMNPKELREPLRGFQ